MSKHTPGPWNTMVSAGSVWGSDGEWVCDPSNGNAYPTDRQRANARLIKAAPDMLAALEAIVADAEYLALVGDNHARRMAAKAAIAKAKGEAE